MTSERLTDEERRLLVAVQNGLPLVEQPYAAVAESLGLTEERVVALLSSLLGRGVVRRIAAVPNHYALGITANGMAVWDVPDDEVNAFGRRLAAAAEVTHCYRRARQPEWRYNLFAMVHGRSREEVLSAIGRIASEAGLTGYPTEVLFSLRQFRKRGARLRETLGADTEKTADSR
ncbi:MAG: Lrp/AsnC family transcriptional regulator [Dehalococcoidia bacterium]